MTDFRFLCVLVSLKNFHTVYIALIGFYFGINAIEIWKGKGTTHDAAANPSPVITAERSTATLYRQVR